MAFNHDKNFKKHYSTETPWEVLNFNHNTHTFNLTFHKALALAEELKTDFKKDYTPVPY